MKMKNHNYRKNSGISATKKHKIKQKIKKAFLENNKKANIANIENISINDYRKIEAEVIREIFHGNN